MIMSEKEKKLKYDNEREYRSVRRDIFREFSMVVQTMLLFMFALLYSIDMSFASVDVGSWFLLVFCGLVVTCMIIMGIFEHSFAASIAEKERRICVTKTRLILRLAVDVVFLAVCAYSGTIGLDDDSDIADIIHIVVMPLLVAAVYAAFAVMAHLTKRRINKSQNSF